MNSPGHELSRDELLRRYGKKSPEAGASLPHRSPFKFLDSYDIDDADIFFGREVETEELLRRFYSHGHVLIYGESGSGKSSLVQCGLRSRIPDADALFIPLRVHTVGLPALFHQICAHAFHALGDYVEVSDQASLVEVLRAVHALASRPVVLLFDQFEELFIFHDPDTRRRFASQLASIPAAKLNVKVIIGIRQDYLALVSELEATVEGLFDNRFWLQRMSRESAAEAVLQACSTCAVELDDDLVRSVIQRLDPGGEGVELPYLQVVMDRLYRQAINAAPSAPVIAASAVEQLGDIGHILATFLVEEVAKLPSPDTGRQILKAFVTREGTRRNLGLEAVAQEAASFGQAIPPDVLGAHLQQLVAVRILRETSGSYELRHDALAATVSGWISEVEKELIEVRDNLLNRFREYEARGQEDAALLDRGFLEYLAVYSQRLTPLLDDVLHRYIEKSQRLLVHAKRKQQVRAACGALAVIAAGFVGLSFYIARITDERALAVAAEAKATAAAKMAKDEARRADIETDKARAELLRSRRLLYVNHIESAHLEWESGNAAAAWKHLNACPADLCGWEYSYLHTLFTRNHQTFGGHTGFVRAVAFNADASRLISGGSDKTIKVWDARTGDEIFTLKGHEGDVNDLAYSSALNKIVSGSDDKTVRVWDAQTGALEKTLLGHTDFVATVAISPNGMRIVSGSDDKTLKLWDANSGSLIKTLEGHSDFVAAVAFNPDGSRIASAGDDHAVMLWDAEQYQLVKTLLGHNDRVNAVAFRSDGRRLVSGSSDQSIKIWDVDTGDILRTLRGHTSGIYSVEFDPLGQQIVSGCRDNTIRLWNASSGRETATLWAHTSTIYDAAFSPDGEQVVSGSRDKSVKLWGLAEAGSRHQELVLDEHTDSVRAVAFSPSENWFISASGDSTLKLWDGRSDSAKRTLTGHSNRVNAISISPDGRQVVSGSHDQTLKLWDLANAAVVRTFRGHTDAVLSVSFSPDGTQIISGSDDQTVKLWSLATGDEKTLRGHKGAVSDVLFSPDGGQIVSAGGRAQRFGELKIWDAQTGSLLAELQGHTDHVACVAFSPDGLTIASGGFDNKLRLWNATTKEEILILSEHTDFVTAVAFSPDGERIATASRDNTIKLWDAATGEETLTLRGHTSGVDDIAFSFDGGRLASASWDATLRVWEAR